MLNGVKRGSAVFVHSKSSKQWQAATTILESDRPTRRGVIFKDDSQLYKVACRRSVLNEER